MDFISENTRYIQKSCDLGNCQRDFTLQNDRCRQFFDFNELLRRFYFIRAPQEWFYLTKRVPQAKIFRFQSAKRDLCRLILRTAKLTQRNTHIQHWTPDCPEETSDCHSLPGSRNWMHDPASRRRPDEQLGGFKEVKSVKNTLNTLSIWNSKKYIKSLIYFAKIELSRAKQMRSLKSDGN